MTSGRLHTLVQPTHIQFKVVDKRENETYLVNDKLSLHNSEFFNLLGVSIWRQHTRVFTVHVLSVHRLYKGVAGYCSAYRGEVCRAVLGEDLLVFFNSSLLDPEDMQENLVQSLWVELDGLSIPCGPAIRSLLCHASFPDCNPSGFGPAPKPVCRYRVLCHPMRICGWMNKVCDGSLLQGALPGCEGAVLP